MLLGMPIWELLDMDMYSVNSLTESVYRIKYTDKNEDAWTAMVAAQGSHENMTKWTKRWKPALGRTFQRATDGVKQFITNFGQGF